MFVKQQKQFWDCCPRCSSTRFCEEVVFEGTIGSDMDYIWTAPAGVTSIQVECWDGGDGVTGCASMARDGGHRAAFAEKREHFRALADR
jgi:hypothetical protein